MTTEKALPDTEIRALLQLLQDEDENTAVVLKKQLQHIMDAQLPSIQSMVSKEFPQLRSTIELLLEESRWETLESDLTRLSGDGEDLDLEEGLFLLSRFAYPRVSRSDISSPLDSMAAEIKQSLSGTDEPSAVIEKINRVLFEAHGFRGNEINYYDPDNSFLFSVLRKKTGLPISLSSIYILLALRLRLPVAGVGLPGHFIVQFKTPQGRVYIDPFLRGRKLTAEDCRMIAARQNAEWDPAYLSPISLRQVLSRTIANLANAYMKINDERRVNFMKRYLAIFE